MNWNKILEQVASIRIKSITDSLFKYSLFFITLGMIAGAIKLDNWMIVVLFSFSGLLVLLGVFFYCFFCFKNPDYLRSESYQLRKKSIELLGDKDHFGNLNIKELKYISSPYGLDSEIKNHFIENVE